MREPTLLPQLFPTPDPGGGLDRERESELMRQHAHLSAMMASCETMYVNMAAPGGHGLAQPSRRKCFTRPSGLARASASISLQRAALLASAALACFCVQRVRSSRAGSFRCGAESLSHLQRMLWT